MLTAKGETGCVFTTSRNSHAEISNGATSDSTATENTALVKHAAPSSSCQHSKSKVTAGIATNSRRKSGVALRNLTALTAGKGTGAGSLHPSSAPKRLFSSWNVRWGSWWTNGKWGFKALVESPDFFNLVPRIGWDNGWKNGWNVLALVAGRTQCPTDSFNETHAI